MAVGHPPYRNPALLAAVFAGGAAGTGLRAWLESAHPAGPGAWPLTTLAINVGGALVLGALLEALALLGPDAGPRRALRLGLGTGLCGGFTTYSTFMVETAQLLRSGHVGVGAGYAGVSLVGGVAAALAGIAAVRAGWLVVARRRALSRTAGRPRDRADGPCGEQAGTRMRRADVHGRPGRARGWDGRWDDC